MNRPLIWFSGAFAAGTALALFSVSFPLLAIAAILALSVVIGWHFVQIRPLCVLIAGLLCGLSYTQAYHTYRIAPVLEVDGTPATITVKALDYAVQYDEQQRVEVRVSGNDVGCPRNFRTLVYLPTTEQEIIPGDTITASIEFYLPQASEGFDRASYYRSEGYYILASAAEGLPVSVNSPAHRPISYYPKSFAHALQQVLSQHGTERQTAFWKALTTGDRSGLTTTDIDHLRRAGLSHVIALSGLHVGFLVSMLLFLLGKRWGTLLGIPMLMMFYLMVGWSPSVVRACVMYGMIMLAFWVRRQNDSLNALAAALLIILVILPDSLESVSLQLSFVSTLGILCFAGRLQNLFRLRKETPWMLKKLYAVLLGSVICTICSSVLTTPFLLYHFGYLSVFSVVSNLLTLWAVSIVFPILILGGILGFAFSGISGFLLTIAGYLTDYIYFISDAIANIRYGVLYCENSLDFAAAVLLSVVLAGLLWKANKSVLQIFLPAMLAVVIGLSVCRGTAAHRDLKVTVLPEGSGQAILISCDNHTALIDCSASSYHDTVQDVAQYMDWRGVESLDLLILTSVDVTHARYACDLLETIPVKQVILPETNRESNEVYPALMQSLETENIPYEKLAPKAAAPVGDASLGLSVLGAVERKLVVRVQADDEDVTIVHALTQNMLLELTETTPLRSDTLVVAGSFLEDSVKMEELLDRIQPEQLILENGWYTPEDCRDIPVINPQETGEVTINLTRD
ncbi:MAG: ComEC/Rec2 family competence protein [Eubacteriales bacterium]|nr:ComEC/Rec2 family competence protein [Eubacteriales bacterium]